MGSFERRGGRMPLMLALALTVAVVTVAARPAEAGEESLAVAAVQKQKRLPFTLTLQGSSGPNEILIWYSISSGRYVITANGLLPQPVGDDGRPITACINPDGKPNRLSCAYRAVAGFEVDAGAGNDTVILTGRVRVSATLFGGAGNDDLAGGGNTDKLYGGRGRDKLAGRNGADYLFGGAHRDQVFGGRGPDFLSGGPGADLLRGGPGRDTERQGPRGSTARRGGDSGSPVQ